MLSFVVVSISNFGNEVRNSSIVLLHCTLCLIPLALELGVISFEPRLHGSHPLELVFILRSFTLGLGDCCVRSAPMVLRIFRSFEIAVWTHF
jgi:hypothetical protein